MAKYNSFKSFTEITDKDVYHFWKSYFNKEDETEKYPEDWRDGYQKARKYVAALDYPLHSHGGTKYSFFFNKNGNVEIFINHGASWSDQNHIHYYASKLGFSENIGTSAWKALDETEWKCLYDGRN